MLQRLKQFREAWKLTKALSEGRVITTENGDEITSEELKAMLKVELPIGDGGAVFFPDATEEEYQDFLQNEEKGWGKLFDRFKKK